MKTAAAYARVSSHEQTQGTSLDSQVREAEKYASLKMLTLVTSLVDAGISGGKPLASRPAGAQLTNLIESGQITNLIIAKLDRAFRSASDCLTTVEAWDKLGVSLHIMDLGGQALDTGTPLGKFFLTVMAAAAELERNLINARCESGREARRSEGKRLGTVPYGYTTDNEGHLVPDAHEQGAVHTLMRLHITNPTWSLNRLAVEMNRLGYTKRGGGRWDHKLTKTILNRVEMEKKAA